MQRNAAQGNTMQRGDQIAGSKDPGGSKETAEKKAGKEPEKTQEAPEKSSR
jgi:hypothetical protein